MRVVVVGAKGFVGTGVVRGLLARGHEVTAVELRPGPGRLADVADQIEWVIGDGSSLETLYDAVGRRPVDVIYYGPYYRPDPQTRGVERELGVMAVSAWQTFGLARALAVKRIVFPSSTAVHGVQPDDGRAVSEESRVLPNTMYGAYKLTCEHVAGRINTELGDAVIAAVRLPSIYGPGADVASRRVNVPAVSAARGVPGHLDYVPAAQVCLAHIEDCSDGLISVMEAERLGHHVFELGGLTASFAEIAEAVRTHVPGADIRFGEEERSILPYAVAWDRGRAELGFAHRDLDTGMWSIIEYERAKRNAATVLA